MNNFLFFWHNKNAAKVNDKNKVFLIERNLQSQTRSSVMFTFLTGGVIQAAPAFSSFIRHSNLKGIDSNRMASDSNRFENGRRRSGMRFQFKFFLDKKVSRNFS